MLAFIVFGDAGWATAWGHASQAGHVILAAGRKVLKGEWGMTSVLGWRSHKIKRLVESAPAAEIMGTSKSLAQGDYHRCLWQECVDPGFSLANWRYQREVPSLVIVTDSKCNYDHLKSETTGPPEDRRSALEVALVRQDLQRPGIQLRWCDSKAQLADPLTKSRGDADLLRATCKHGCLVLMEAPETMLLKKQERDERAKQEEEERRTKKEARRKNK